MGPWDLFSPPLYNTPFALFEGGSKLRGELYTKYKRNTVKHSCKKTDLHTHSFRAVTAIVEPRGTLHTPQ